MYRLRPALPSTDEPGIASVVNTFEQNPVSVETVHEWLIHDAPGRISFRRVAVNGEDAVVGYAVSVHETWDPEGQFYAWAGVAPAWRGRGIGAALYSDMLEFLKHHNASTVTSEVRDDCAVSQAFARRRGFENDRHLFQSSLDLEHFDESPYAQIIADSAASGLRIHSLADFGDTPEARGKLYEVNAITDRDVPGWTGPGLSFEEFNEWVYEAGWYRPDGQLLAADGDRWVGICAVRLYPEVRQAFNVHTGVIRSYRRRNIALALKLAAIRYARSQGARSISTHNDSTNSPMLALNRKLGYVPEPGRYTLRKTVK
ncbi:MAG: GNAT family N-acetyltransferase [Gemmatimonadetes bacterium]|nr:GNAT family N-acetyltransferase [Gemmatimonadota bacterium]MYG84309.1 GNAT family N-acetyltransferase [Gemmatimonadota bacterium]MYJ88888.1 GNAT family N-acetyltransferase [Gemmatimonadota bacterium]